MESQKDNYEIVISDFESTVKLDLRGKIIKVRQYILLESVYFRNMLGMGEFKVNTSCDENGSYFIDCDEDVFRELLCWMEFGIPKSIYGQPGIVSGLNPSFIKREAEKYGISLPSRKHVSKKEKEDVFKSDLINSVSDYIKTIISSCSSDFETGNIQREIEFYVGQTNSFAIMKNLICTYTNNNRPFVNMIIKSIDIIVETFKSCTVEGYTIEYEKCKRFSNNKIIMNIIKNNTQKEKDDLPNYRPNNL
jgi:hypothetical protein